MIRSWSRQSKRRATSLIALPILLLLDFGPGAAYGQQPAKPEAAPSEKPPGQEFASRGQRAAREIKYSDWRKTCFKAPGTNLACRTSIAGTFATGQSAVRIDLIEREGDKTRGYDCCFLSACTCRPAPGSRSTARPPTGFPMSGASPTPASRPIWPIPGCSRKWKAAKYSRLRSLISACWR